MNNRLENIINIKEQKSYLAYTIKWLIICLIISPIIGSFSAIFLLCLDWASNFRDSHLWIIALLPIAGLAIGAMYYIYGNSVLKGNNLLLEEFRSPKKIIPLRMVPLIFVGTILTHLFGGSAGREGTAVQIGGAIADRFTKLLNLSNEDRKIIIIIGISAGFASVFGTPLAGAIFALEVVTLGKIKLNAIIPSFLAAIFANYFCSLYPISHTQYYLSELAIATNINPINIIWAILSGIVFGLVAMLFSKSIHYWGNLFNRLTSYIPLQTTIGGAILVIAIFAVYKLTGETKYAGLGIATIKSAFYEQSSWYDFIAKLLFTTFTLGCGFKGGEVTPLFFIGATLGSALSFLIPLEMSLLAAMGFVAVFAGATNTPIACIFMGIELFGIESGYFIAIACCVAYLFSGYSGIYSSQFAFTNNNLSKKRKYHF